MRAFVVLGKAALRIMAAVAIALISFPLIVFSFHPFEGPVDGYSSSTQPERYFALAGSVVVLVYALWRLLRGPTLREQLGRAMNPKSRGNLGGPPW
jgi:hypothetical protein